MTTFSVGKYTMTVREDGYVGMTYRTSQGNYEPYVVSVMREVLRPGDVFLDVGANWGFYPLMVNEILGEKCQVIAVEPNPFNVEVLCRNVRENGLGNVTVVSCAAGSGFSVARYPREGENHNGTLNVEAEGCPVVVAPLDVLLGGIHPTVAKIDVEGFEQQVLFGAERTLRGTDRLFIEVFPDYLRQHGVDPALLVVHLFQAGFTRCRDIRWGGEYTKDNLGGIRDVQITDLLFTRE